MTSEIFNQYLRYLNERMRLANRNILLFLDNAPVHCLQVQTVLTHIKLKTFPANTTSGTQPLDAGIIRNFKLYYRKFFLQTIIDKSENMTKKAEEVIPTIHIHHAITWILKSWNENVHRETITACWRKVGFIFNADPQHNRGADEVLIHEVIYSVERLVINQGEQLEIQEPLIDIEVVDFPVREEVSNLDDYLFAPIDQGVNAVPDDEEEEEEIVEMKRYTIDEIIQAWKIFKEGVAQREMKDLMLEIPHIEFLFFRELESKYQQSTLEQFFHAENTVTK